MLVRELPSLKNLQKILFFVSTNALFVYFEIIESKVIFTNSKQPIACKKSFFYFKSRHATVKQSVIISHKQSDNLSTFQQKINN